jgi:hypothetical protein
MLFRVNRPNNISRPHINKLDVIPTIWKEGKEKEKQPAVPMWYLSVCTLWTRNTRKSTYIRDYVQFGQKKDIWDSQETNTDGHKGETLSVRKHHE